MHRARHILYAAGACMYWFLIKWCNIYLMIACCFRNRSILKCLPNFLFFFFTSFRQSPEAEQILDTSGHYHVILASLITVMSVCHLVPPIPVVTSANGSWFIERTCWWGLVINCHMINSRQQHGKNWKFQHHHEKCKGWQTCNCNSIAKIWLFDSRIPYLLFSKSYRYFCSLYSLNILINVFDSLGHMIIRHESIRYMWCLSTVR